MLVVTQLGGVTAVMGGSLVLALLAYLLHRLRLAATFIAILPAELFNAALKIVFRRVRPDTLYVQRMPIRSKSFPSGHAFGSLVLYGLAAYLASVRLPTVWSIVFTGIMAILVLLVGVSRIYLGAHYALDVLAGWLVGGGALVLIIQLLHI